MLATKTATSIRTVLTSTRWSRSMSSPPSRAGRSPRSTATPSATASTISAPPRTSGTARGPSGSVPVLLLPSVEASTSTRTPSSTRNAQTPNWARSRVGPAETAVPAVAPVMNRTPPTSGPRRGERERSSPPGSCQAQLLQRALDSRRLLRQEGCELVSGKEGVGPAVLGQHVLPLLATVHRGEGGDQCGLVGVGDLGWGDHAAPVGELEIDAGLLQRGRIDRSHPLSPADGQHAHLAGLDLVEELAEAGGAERDLAAQQGRQQVAAAVVGDEVDLAGIDADGLSQLHGQQVVRSARRRPAS